MIRYAFVLLILLTCHACGDGADAPTASPAVAPGTTASTSGDEGMRAGKPVAPDTLTFTFERFVMPSDAVKRAAEFSVSNGFSKDIAAVTMTLIYQDSAGKTIRPYQWSISEAPVWLEAGATTTTVAGHRIPEDVKSVDVVVREITFQDGSSISPKGGE